MSVGITGRTDHWEGLGAALKWAELTQDNPPEGWLMTNRSRLVGQRLGLTH